MFFDFIMTGSPAVIASVCTFPLGCQVQSFLKNIFVSALMFSLPFIVSHILIAEALVYLSFLWLVIIRVVLLLAIAKCVLAAVIHTERVPFFCEWIALSSLLLFFFLGRCFGIFALCALLLAVSVSFRTSCSVCQLLASFCTFVIRQLCARVFIAVVSQQ